MCDGPIQVNAGMDGALLPPGCPGVARDMSGRRLADILHRSLIKMCREAPEPTYFMVHGLDVALAEWVSEDEGREAFARPCKEVLSDFLEIIDAETAIGGRPPRRGVRGVITASLSLLAGWVPKARRSR